MTEGSDVEAAERDLAPSATTFLVTGAAGFIGREIVSQLCEERDKGRDITIRVLLRSPAQASLLPSGVDVICGDLLDESASERLCSGVNPKVTCFIHSAARISLKRRDKVCEEVNIRGTKNVISACKKFGIRRLVAFSSVDALIPPARGETVLEPKSLEPERLPTSYGRSKAEAAERILAAAQDGPEAVLLYPSAVIGPGDYRNGFLSSMLSLYLKGLPPVGIRGGYDFVDVRDVAAAAIAAGTSPRVGSGYILGNRYAEVTEVFDTMAEYIGRKPTRFSLPAWSLYPLTPPVCGVCAILGKDPPLTHAAVKHMCSHPTYSHAQAKKDLGFSPRPLKDTITDTVDFLRARSEK